MAARKTARDATAAAATASSNRELAISRIIDPPRERVFKAWTTQLPQWCGPRGMTTPVCEMDLRTGAFRAVMRTRRHGLSSGWGESPDRLVAFVTKS